MRVTAERFIDRTAKKQRILSDFCCGIIKILSERHSGSKPSIPGGSGATLKAEARRGEFKSCSDPAQLLQRLPGQRNAGLFFFFC